MVHTFQIPNPDRLDRLVAAAVPDVSRSQAQRLIEAGLVTVNGSVVCKASRAVPARPEHLIASTDYGQPFASVVGRDNICAIQFHPEKSQQVGLRILKNFVEFASEKISHQE